MNRWLPYPLLSVALLFMWLLLNSFSLGHLLLGSVIAVTASWAMSALEPSKPRIKRWDVIVRMLWIFLIDITKSNIAVVKIILGGSRYKAQPGFISIPLELRDRTGLAILACIITSTPGTAWINFDPKKGTLLIHVLDLTDGTDWKKLIKARYEKLLMEIFE
ncbi:MAG: Na+/H+ antiporter subunit E [Phyllobacterium sp.]